MKIELIKLIKNRFFLIIMIVFIFVPFIADIIDHDFFTILNNSTSVSNIEVIDDYKIMVMSSLTMDNVHFLFLFLPIAIIDNFNSPFNYSILKDKRYYWLNKLFVSIIVTIVLYFFILITNTLIMNIKFYIIDNIYNLDYQVYCINGIKMDTLYKSIYVMLVFFLVLSFSNNIIIWYLFSIVTLNLISNSYVSYGILVPIAIVLYYLRRRKNDKL